MALIGNIDGQPVYDKVEEALTWAKQNGLTGYHTHVVAGKTVYMGGVGHSQAVNTVSYPHLTLPTTPYV